MRSTLFLSLGTLCLGDTPGGAFRDYTVLGVEPELLHAKHKALGLLPTHEAPYFLVYQPSSQKAGPLLPVAP